MSFVCLRDEVFPAWRTLEGVRADEEAADRDRFGGGWWSTQTVSDRTGVHIQFRGTGGKGGGLRGECGRVGT